MGISKPSQAWAKHQKDMAVLYFSNKAPGRNIKKIWLSYKASKKASKRPLEPMLDTFCQHGDST
ncbi:hypothetical protein GCM10011520_06410 [Shewanella carassii]|uniref:Uncharacterized protein n=1 Tax=Shewanella carassii TaxID=1987584 RepID=A0ABQ1SZM1_9GAMM|nr:hypothetical protein GCM10011520_06410 [Shewanella carassii]